MRFRTILFVSLSVVATIPGAVLTSVQLSEAERRAAQVEELLVGSAKTTASGIANELRVARQLVRITSLTAAESMCTGAMSGEVRQTLSAALRTMVDTTPLLLNAHIDDSRLRSIVFYPEVNEAGDSNLGRDHSDRPHAQALRSQPGVVLMSPVFEAVGAYEGKTVNLSMPVVSPGTNENIGVVSAALNLSAVIDERVVRLSDASRVAVFDANGTRVFPAEKTPFDAGAYAGCGTSQVCRHQAQGQAWFAVVQRLPQELGSWSVVVYRDARPILSEKLSIWQTAAATLLLVLALSAVLVGILSYWFGQAVEKLNRHSQSGRAVPVAEDRVSFPKELADVQQTLQKTAVQLQNRNEALAELNRGLEQKVRERTQSLEQRNRLLQALFDGMAEAVLLFDAQGRCRRANRRSEEMLTQQQAQQLYRQYAQIPDDGVRTVTLQQRTLEIVCFELPEVYEEGTMGMLVRDVTDREAINAMKQTLLSMAAHELKTPVHVMRLQIDALGRHLQSNLSDSQKTLLRDLEDSASHLQELVRDWLDVARIDAGAFEIERRPLSLDAVIRKAVRLAQVRWPDQTVRIHIDEDAEGIMGDANRLQQLFFNLLSNSARYARAGVPSTVNIDCRIKPTDSNIVRIIVADNGIGICREHAERIFDRFYQIEKGNRRRSGGTGLGLVIVRAIVEAHGGSIRLLQDQNDAMAGAAFEIEIPCYSVADSL